MNSVKTRRVAAARIIAAMLLIVSLVLPMALSARPDAAKEAMPPKTVSPSMPDTGDEAVSAADTGSPQTVITIGPAETPNAGLDGNAGDGTGASLAIQGIKTITGEDAHARYFTFTLAQVGDDQGGAFAGAPAISQGVMYEEIDTDGAGDYGFLFEISGLKSGYYFFKLTEQPGAAGDGWDDDKSEYIFKVSVDEYGLADMDYRARTGPTAPWGEWARYSGGYAAGTSSSENVNMPPYMFEKENGYFTFFQELNPGTTSGIGAESKTYMIMNSAGNAYYYPMGADHTKDTPAPKQALATSGSRDDMESALLYSLRAGQNTLGLPGLSIDDLNRFLGTGISSPDHRTGYIRCMVHMYEEAYRNGTCLDLDDPLYWASGSTGQAMTGYMLKTLKYEDNPANRDEIESVFRTINNNLQGHMAQYNAGQTTSLAMSYIATGAKTGVLSFGHNGYVPTDKDGAEKYNTSLTWTPAYNVTVEVTRDGNTFPLANGSEVYKSDTISVTNNSGAPVTLMLTDKARYLSTGSIKGDMLKAVTEPLDVQPMVVGYAGFETLKNIVTTCDEPLYLPFRSAYTEKEDIEGPDPALPETGGGRPLPVTFHGRKTVAGADAPEKAFTFTLTQVHNAQGGEFTGTPVISQGVLTQEVKTSGAGEYSFPFDTGSLEKGEYYFILKEQPGAGNEGAGDEGAGDEGAGDEGTGNEGAGDEDKSKGTWAYDDSEYMIRVTVSESFGIAMDHRLRTGPDAPWSAWVEYNGGFAAGTPSSEKVEIPPYTFNKDSNRVFFIEEYYPGPGGGIGKLAGTFKIEDKATGIKYYPMCADHYIRQNPQGGQLHTRDVSRDDMESALFFSLRAGPNNLGLPGLPIKDWSRFLGVYITNADERVSYMRCMLWMYEEGYRNGFTPNFDDPAYWKPGGTGHQMAGFVLDYTDRKDRPANRTAVERVFKTMNKNTKGIMAQYRAGKTTTLDMSYKAADAETGALFFSHDGYVPTDINGVELYSTKLAWAPTEGVTVEITRDGHAFTLAPGGEVKKTDTISVTNKSGGPVTFTLTDSAIYLSPGSIKGDILKAAENPFGVQPMIIGSAGFETLNNTVSSCGEPAYLPFLNTWANEDEEEDEDQEYGPVLPDAGGGGTLPFTIGAALLSAAISVLIIVTLIQRGHRRNRCLA